MTQYTYHGESTNVSMRVGESFTSRDGGSAIPHTVTIVGFEEVGSRVDVYYTSALCPGWTFHDPAWLIAAQIRRGTDTFLGGAWERQS
jgi:hypothetical protein